MALVRTAAGKVTIFLTSGVRESAKHAIVVARHSEQLACRPSSRAYSVAVLLIERDGSQHIEMPWYF